MADDKPLRSRIQGHLRCLTGGGMPPLLPFRGKLVRVCGLVINDRRPLEPGAFLLERGSVRAVGVAPGLVRLVGRCGKGDHGAIGPLHVLSPFEGADFGEREAVLRDALFPYIIEGLLFPEQEAEGLYPVVQGESQNLRGLCFQDGLRGLHLQGREADLEGNAFTVVAQEELQDGAEICRRKDIEGYGAAFHAQCGQKAEDAEHVVPVDVGYKDRVQFHHGHTVLHHLVLRPLAAVYKEQAPMHLKCLGALGPVPYRHGRSRAKHGDLEDAGRITHPLRVCP